MTIKQLDPPEQLRPKLYMYKYMYFKVNKYKMSVCYTVRKNPKSRETN